MRFLAFDCLVIDDQNVMGRPLDKRYGVRPLTLLQFHARAQPYPSEVEAMVSQALREDASRPSPRCRIAAI